MRTEFVHQSTDKICCHCFGGEVPISLFWRERKMTRHESYDYEAAAVVFECLPQRPLFLLYGEWIHSIVIRLSKPSRQAYTRMRKFSLHDRDNTNKRLLSMLFTAICNISSASLTTRGYPIKFALSLFQFSNRVMMMPTRVMANSYRQGSIAANHFVQSC